jgi:RNA polymerase sigma-70 factor (ECF subfamily)
MGTAMASESVELDPLLRRAIAGDSQALSQVFAAYRDRLWQMIRIRLDRRIQGRVDPSDVLQEAYVDIARRIGDYATQADFPFYLWLRQLVAQRLIDVHRQHLGARMRDARQEVVLSIDGLPQATSASLAAQLMGQWTSASQAVERAELQARVQSALDAMDPIDREILALRHFEMLSNTECAQVLGLSKGAASKRYIRALKRTRELLSDSGGPDAA